jgi:hypothetical protein
VVPDATCTTQRWPSWQRKAIWLPSGDHDGRWSPSPARRRTDPDLVVTYRPLWSTTTGRGAIDVVVDLEVELEVVASGLVVVVVSESGTVMLGGGSTEAWGPSEEAAVRT